MPRNEPINVGTSTFESLREYYHLNCLIIWNMHCEIEEHFQEKARKVLKKYHEEKSITIESASWDLHYIQAQLTTQARYSFLPRFLSLFEGVLKNICKLSNEDEYKKVDQRNWLKTHRKFLKDQSVRLDEVASHLSNIRQLMLIRDCIVHADGIVNNCKSPDAVRDAVAAIAKVHINLGIGKDEVITVHEDDNRVLLDRQVVPTTSHSISRVTQILFHHSGYPLDISRWH